MSSSPRRADQTRRRRAALWAAAFASVAALLVARNLIGLGSAPVGAYVDETSIGYNAWAIASAGVDEHGAHLPLYFTAFGEYKNPVYIYTLAVLLKVAPLTVVTERLPAAMFGIAACLFLTLLAWQRARSRGVALLVLALCALTPWLTIESRVGFEVVSMLATLSCAMWCLSVAVERHSARWYAAAGGALALSVYAYSTGRVAILLLAGALAVGLGAEGRRGRAWLAALPPVGGAYAVLAWWNFAHPGALTARFDLINIWADGAAPLVVAGRFVGNYLTYFGPHFLFLNGDARLRHATGFGGMLPLVMLPLLLAGAAAMWRRRREPYIRVLALFVLVAPVSAALTNESVPHSLRAAVMLPMLVGVAIEGLRMLCEWRARPVVLAVAATALAVQGALFTADMYGAWPTRSAIDFDAGEIDAIVRAHALAGATPLLLSSTLDAPYISAAFALRPRPPSQYTADSQDFLLAEMNMRMIDGAAPAAPSGSVAVLSVFDPPPAGATLLFVQTAPPPRFWIGERPQQYASVLVYELR
ncbi:MAG: hypothetical protein ACYDAC_10795 [Candidatus Dormibacteria bacterium]